MDWHGPATTSLAELSYRLHRELAEEHGGASRWGYRTLETLSIDAHVERKAKKARTIADSYAWLNADILAGAPSVLGTTATTAQAHPAQLTAAFADLAQERGAKLVHDTVKTAERTADGRIRLGLESGESIVVDKVVVCAGPWTGRLASELQINLGRRANKIEGSRAHSIVLKPRSGSLPAQALFTNIKQGKNVSEPEIYNRPDNTAYACGPTDGSELPIHASDVQVDPKAVASIQANVAHLSPLLSDADILTRQACYLPVGSGDPVIGQSPTDGFYVAAGSARLLHLSVFGLASSGKQDIRAGASATALVPVKSWPS